jgi:hypothetical protein
VWKPKSQSITDNQETQATLGKTDRTFCENRRANLRCSRHVLSVLPSIACVSWLSVIDWLFGFHTMFCRLCPVLPLSLDYHFLIGPSVFTQCSVCCAQCCLCLLVISYWLALRFSHNVLSVVPSVACVSGLSLLDLFFSFHTMLNQEMIIQRHRQHWAQQTEHCVKTEEQINNW